MSLQNYCCAVIAAAGTSSRMNFKISKQFLPIMGVPAIVRTIRAFEAAGTINSIVIVCRQEDREQMKILVEGSGAKKIKAIVPGGATRQQSVAAGVAAVPSETEWVAIHDGARPLVRPEEIDACVEDARRYGAAALAVPVKDTIKTADNAGFIVSTPQRKWLWAVQTPQVFPRKAYEKAIEKAGADSADYTDDCQLFEHTGVRVHLCRGSYENLKLTTPDDILAAESVLQHREELL